MDKYAGYTKEATAEAVAALFEQKHGGAPFEVLDAGAIWLAGPLGENGNGKSGAQMTHSRETAKRGLLARVEAEQVEVTPERARQLALEWEATVQ